MRIFKGFLLIFLMISVSYSSFFDAIKNSITIRDNTTGKTYDYYGNEIKNTNKKTNTFNVKVNLNNKPKVVYNPKTEKYEIYNQTGIIDTYEILKAYKEAEVLHNSLNLIISNLTNKIKDEEFYYDLQKFNRLLVGQKPGMDTSVNNFSNIAGIIAILKDAINYIKVKYPDIPINKIDVNTANYINQIQKIKKDISSLRDSNSKNSKQLKILIKDTLNDLLEALNYIDFNVNIYSQYRIINEFSNTNINNKEDLKNYIYQEKKKFD